MSKISQELKVLLYLNQRYARTRWVSISEIAKYLEVSTRQARRYLEDLKLTGDGCGDFIIETELGRYGGYRLKSPIDKGFAMPENIVLAMSIAMKRNDKIEKVLSELPNYVITDSILGDNFIDNDILDSLEIIIKAISTEHQLKFFYKDYEKPILVDPYRIVLTNHTYYLYAVNNDTLKKYDVRFVKTPIILGGFKLQQKVIDNITESLKMYGIKDGKSTKLRVKCKDIETLKTFDKYFEGKGTMDEKELTYEVIGSSENELYYPLFRISTHSFSFIDYKFKNDYLKYLENQIKSIKGEDKNGN